MSDNQGESISPAFEEGIIKDGVMYAFDNRISALCSTRLDDGHMDILEKYDGEEAVYVKRIFTFGNRFVMQHGRTAKLLVFHVEEHEYTTYQHANIDDTIYNAVPIGDCLVLLPLFDKGWMLYFDVKRGTYNKCSGHTMSDLIGEKMIFRPYLYERQIVFPSQRDNAFISVSLTNYSVEKVKLFDAADIVPYIATWDGEVTWVIEKKADRLYGFGRTNQKIDVPKGTYGNVVVLQDHICLMPIGDSPFVVVSKTDGMVRTIDIPFPQNSSDEMTAAQQITRFVYCSEDDAYIYIFPNGEGKMNRIDKKSFVVGECMFTCGGYVKREMELFFRDERIRVEDTERGLTQLMEMIK